MGAVSVCFCSASPAIIYPNVYGIDMPNVDELVAHNRDEAAIAEHIGADLVSKRRISQLAWFARWWLACGWSANGSVNSGCTA